MKVRIPYLALAAPLITGVIFMLLRMKNVLYSSCQQIESRRSFDVLKTDTPFYIGPARLAIVMPYTSANRSLVLDSMEHIANVGSPCVKDFRTGRFPAKENAQLVFLSNFNETSEDRSLIAKARKILGAHVACFSKISLMSASLLPEENDYPAGPNNMFFKTFLDPHLQQLLGSATHMFWMEHDVTPLRTGWVDALLRQTSKRPFWIAGSPYRGDGLDSTSSDRKHWSWVGHINGNALYDLKDPAFHDYLRLVIQYEPPNQFWKPFDRSIWSVLHAFPHTWPLHQKYRSKFVYADFIYHWGFQVTENDLARSLLRPSVYLIHGASTSASNWHSAPQPRPPDMTSSDQVHACCTRIREGGACFALCAAIAPSHPRE